MPGKLKKQQSTDNKVNKKKKRERYGAKVEQNKILLTGWNFKKISHNLKIIQEKDLKNCMTRNWRLQPIT